MALKVGDRVSMEVRQRGLSMGMGMGVGPVPKRRTGEIRAVLIEDPPRYEIAWDRGNTSIYSPSLSELKLEEPAATAERG